MQHCHGQVIETVRQSSHQSKFPITWLVVNFIAEVATLEYPWAFAVLLA